MFMASSCNSRSHDNDDRSIQNWLPSWGQGGGGRAKDVQTKSDAILQNEHSFGVGMNHTIFSSFGVATSLLLCVGSFQAFRSFIMVFFWNMNMMSFVASRSGNQYFTKIIPRVWSVYEHDNRMTHAQNQSYSIQHHQYDLNHLVEYCTVCAIVGVLE